MKMSDEYEAKKLSETYQKLLDVILKLVFKHGETKKQIFNQMNRQIETIKSKL